MAPIVSNPGLGSVRLPAVRARIRPGGRALLNESAFTVYRPGPPASLRLTLMEGVQRGSRRVDSRTVIVVISDGWDRGDVEQLRRAMANLSRRAYKILWLNPLAGGKDYQPLARGVAAALPYIDHFLPAHSLDSLSRVARTLVHLARA